MVSGQCSNLWISWRHVYASRACRKKLRELEREFWCCSSLLDGACSSSSLLWRRKRCWSPLWYSRSAFFPRGNSDLEVSFWRSYVLQTRNLRLFAELGSGTMGTRTGRGAGGPCVIPKLPAEAGHHHDPRGFRARRPWRQELSWESKHQPWESVPAVFWSYLIFLMPLH